MHLLNTRDSGFQQALTALLAFETAQDPAVDTAVANIIADVQTRGDAALLDYTTRFDRFVPASAAALELTAAELKAAFESGKITRADLAAYDLVLPMTREHHRALERLARAVRTPAVRSWAAREPLAQARWTALEPQVAWPHNRPG